MSRRSVRHYKSTPVPEADLKIILDAARMAPTSGNQQPWQFIVVKDPQVIDELKKACLENSRERMKEWMGADQKKMSEQMAKAKAYYDKCFSAPVYVAILTDNESKYPTYNHWDGPLAAATLMIAARSLGYGTVHYTDSVPASVTKKVLNIPDPYERVCFTPIGIPEAWPEAPSKKEYDSFIVADKF